MKISKRKKRRVWLAFVLSLLYPGLGQIYCGRLARGLGLLIGLNVLFSLSVFILSKLPTTKLALGVYLFLLSTLLTVLSVDAFFIAKKTPPHYRLKEYNRWYCYIFFIFLIYSFRVGITDNNINKYVQPLRIVSSSMFPSIEVNDRIVVYKDPGWIIEPQVGDIIQFPHYAFSKTPILKRVVACGGDTVEIKDNQLIINDVPLQRTFLQTTIHHPLDLRETEKDALSYLGGIYIEHNHDVSYPVFIVDDPNYVINMPKRTIPSGGVFVLGDSRNLSTDSRRFGYVPESQIEGIARYLIWTSGDWSRWGFIDAKSNEYSMDTVQANPENGVDVEEQSLFQNNEPN